MDFDLNLLLEECRKASMNRRITKSKNCVAVLIGTEYCFNTDLKNVKLRLGNDDKKNHG